MIGRESGALQALPHPFSQSQAEMKWGKGALAAEEEWERVVHCCPHRCHALPLAAVLPILIYVDSSRMATFQTEWHDITRRGAGPLEGGKLRATTAMQLRNNGQT